MANAKPFSPMLAGTPQPDHAHQFPLIASPKLDGIRAVSRQSALLSRSLKPIPNKLIQTVLSLPEMDGLDGELTVGPANDPNVMQNTTTIVMSNSKVSAFEYHVFDYFNDKTSGFAFRYELVKKRVAQLQKDWVSIAVALRLEGYPFLKECPIKMVPHLHIFDQEQLEAYEAEQLAAGFEGIMIRSPNGLYKHGRSTPKEGALLKLKRFTDGEALIVGFEEEMENTNAKTVNELGRSKRSSHKDGKVGKGTLGAFKCRRIYIAENGERVVSSLDFNIGSGINDELAAEVWANRNKYLNKIVKFKHFEHGVVNAPRHPVFLGFRDPKDM